ncbi:MAG: PCRF domain-containing protein, partial [Clostridia bacterium]|nr:PCRF domain-containing protein [Clostridia bacterium]
MIIQLDEAKRTLKELEPELIELGDALKIEKLRVRAEELDEQTMMPDFWNDQTNSGKILREVKQLKDKIAEYDELMAKHADTVELTELAIEEEDESFLEEILQAVEDIKAQEEKMRIEVLLSGEYDASNAILSFHPGAGGTEAQDWALMLYRMYTRWGEKKGFNVKLIDWLDGEEAGLKSATIMIEGLNAYGFLKSENGVHRLVRVSPFDSSGRRHTSFASVEVMPEFNDDGTIEIAEEDLEITTHKSSGAGGQHINKT